MEKLADVYSILIGNPFGAALPKGESDEGSNEGVPRIVRNQILIRGAPVVARSLTAAGTATMAAGIAIHSKPVKTKQFLHVSRRHRIEVLKFEHGRNWKQAWRAERKKYVHYDPRSSLDVTAQQGRSQRRQRAGRNLTATTLRGAGGAMYVAGRLVPTIAASMVLGSYLKGPTGEPATQIDILGGEVRPDTGGLAQDVARIHAMNVASIDQGFTLVSTSYYLGKAVLGEIL